ncbi:L,D-transpeptidase family protein [Polycladidibacter stylochi]|uniref:L,D-transpeptidase family protein n=1 Tax=Polycladidibacter stylochi TaxID=1807766 RepID=UPI000833A157|nr:murein L,D-transpeptidase family protein [Pseudovibrio stylochi]
MQRFFKLAPIAAFKKNTTTYLAVIGISIALVGCQTGGFGIEKADQPVSSSLKRAMKRKNMALKAPVLVRIFKEESELEVWKQTKDGTYALLETYDICKYSGKLGPKFKEGDRQAPEGFYEVSPGRMNPNSSYYLSFNLGFPNKYDRAHGRTGSNLMVHGACSSRGCYAMTDEQIADIYALGRDAFLGGQRKFQVQAYPFHMTAQNMAKHRHSRHFAFWKMLKVGYDQFEVSHKPPKVEVCEGKYVFNPVVQGSFKSFNANGLCPAYKLPADIAPAYAKRKANDAQIFAKYVQREEASKTTINPVATMFGSAPQRAQANPKAPKLPPLIPQPNPTITSSTQQTENSADESASSFFSSLFSSQSTQNAKPGHSKNDPTLKQQPVLPINKLPVGKPNNN